MLTMDDLFGPDEPSATFHDAYVQRIRIDYGARRFDAIVSVSVEDPGAADYARRERYRTGRLTVEGLRCWCMESWAVTGEPLWLTGDGFLGDAPTEAGKSLATQHVGAAVRWWLFFSDLNAFAYLVGERASFAWE